MKNSKKIYCPNIGYVVISINECPHGTRMLSLDGHSSGTRYSGAGCCGRWTVVEQFGIKAKDLECMAEEARDLESERDEAKGLK